jgi:hypothetical protein
LWTNLPAENKYEYFKAQLLDIHQLSDYEKFDMLSKMEPMGGRKPSQLLHAMLENCPVGMEKHLSFHYFFMQRLPQALRTQLGEVQPGNPRALAARADKLWSVHSTVKGGTLAAAEAEETTPASITAVRGGTRGCGDNSRGRGGPRGRQRMQPASAAAPTASGVPAADPTPSDLARASSGLCHFHWVYADKAGRCVVPCSCGN